MTRRDAADAADPADPDAPAAPAPARAALTQRGRKTRQAVLDAAEVEFGRAGFAAASIVDITRRAGVAQGTFYTYFPSKEAVFGELVRTLSHRLREEIALAVAGLDQRADVERAGLRAFLGFVARHRELYRIVRQAEFVDPELFRWYYRRMAAGYVRGLEAAERAGQVEAADLEVTAWALMGIADFVGMRWVLWADGEPEPPPDVDRVVDTVMALLEGGVLRRGR